MQQKVAHVGASVREHVTPDSHSATTATSSRAGGRAVPLAIVCHNDTAPSRDMHLNGTVQEDVQ